MCPVGRLKSLPRQVVHLFDTRSHDTHFPWAPGRMQAGHSHRCHRLKLEHRGHSIALALEVGPTLRFDPKLQTRLLVSNSR